MADNTLIGVTEAFDMQAYSDALAAALKAQGYDTKVNRINESSAVVSVEKDFSGFKKFIGLGLSVKANLTVANGTLTISYTDAEWTNKIIAYVIGAIVSVACIGFVLIVTAILGTVNQLNLPKKISEAANAVTAK